MGRVIEEGNVVKVYKLPGGTVKIMDAAYINKTEEELEAIRDEARRIAYNIAYKAELRALNNL